MFDSLYAIVLHEEITPESIANDSLFYFRTTPYFSNEFDTEAFEKLSEVGNGRTREQDSILNLLKSQYNSNNVMFAREHLQKNRDLCLKISESRKQFSWFTNSILGKAYGQEEMDYYLNNPDYKREIANLTHETLGNTANILRRWEQDLLDNYKLVYGYLDERNIKHSDSLLFGYDPSLFQNYIGKYKFKAVTSKLPKGTLDSAKKLIVVLEMKDDKIMMTTKDFLDLPVFPPSEIIPINKYSFRTLGGCWHVVFDKNNAVTGLNLIQGVTIASFEKIE